ncbi:Fic family protein [archaeon]|jgi:Fic family protein|nr:Fic family protein [Candidatus Woesearchaeota archaeon]MBT4136245.1 Fic family protein [archaeon]MBT4241672.1 Fic family protein [archaeon]MBT4418067.1 Fic family protein [archaeon]
MVYIYKKKIGNKNYYYLRVSKRKNGKIIVKDIAYLGSTLDEIKKTIQEIPNYKNEIKKTYKTINNFLESNRYIEKIKKLKPKKDKFLKQNLIEIEACQLHFIKEFKKQNYLTKQEIWKNFVIEFAFNTTSIEGNTINLAEAKELLENEKTPKDKTLREVYDLKNTKNVFNEFIDSKNELTHDLIIETHKKLLENIDKRIGYRAQEVRVIKSNFKATPAPYIKTDMDLLLKWYKQNKGNLHPLVLAITFHHKFEKIHPFMDGNGRTGRMLLNYILMKNHYPPLIIKNKNRKKYLDSMRNADKSDLFKLDINNYSNLIKFGSEEMIRSYWNIFL